RPGLPQLLPRLAESGLEPARPLLPLPCPRGDLVEPSAGECQGRRRKLDPGGVDRAEALAAGEDYVVRRLPRSGQGAVDLEALAPFEAQLVAEERALGG